MSLAGILTSYDQESYDVTPHLAQMGIKDKIYLDHHATTPIDPRVLEAMLPFLKYEFGNASSTHCFGVSAQQAVINARRQVSRLFSAGQSDVIFTSGATESNNLAIKGFAFANKSKGRHIITSQVEHNSILNTCRYLETQGFTVTYLTVDRNGSVSTDQLNSMIRKDTILCTLGAANNEIGTIQDIKTIGALCKERNVALHVDAAQSAGKLPIDIDNNSIDMLSISAHKMYGPKGIGALLIKNHPKKIALTPQIHGGDQESGLRSGTLPVHLVVGFGAAASITDYTECERITAMRELLWKILKSGSLICKRNGDAERTLPGTLSVTINEPGFLKIKAALLNIAVSSKSACSSAGTHPSHVLKAIGLSDLEAERTVRFGIGRGNSESDIKFVGAEILKAFDKVLPYHLLAPIYLEGVPSSGEG
jgi:cysteine desulfurase